MADIEFMRLAIAAAQEGMKKGEMPFGACLVKARRVVTTVHNVARASMDITAHAEMHAIREACRLLRTLDLSGSTIYASCEPCPMCFSACFWAKVDRIVFASRIEDAERLGIWQMPISSANMGQLSRASIQVTGDLLREDSLELFKQIKR